jgi:hypothetical protein
MTPNATEDAMNTFASAPAALTRLAPLDPSKHVKYTLGMVLGVDDFDQEFAYLAGRDRWLARDLAGHGTIWGLGLSIDVEAGGPRVNVAPGAAVTPCGQLVCVTPAQCAALNDWLKANAEEVRRLLEAGQPGRQPGPTGPPVLPLHVVLCYRECPTDDVPIPGEPCRTEESLTAPSRVKDAFRLELRTAPPQQPEDDAVRDFVAWLRLVPVVDGPGSAVGELLDAIRRAAAAAVERLGGGPGSPPDAPPVPLDLLLGTPDPKLAIPAAEATEHLRAAFRVWATEVRPALRRVLPGCDGGQTGACGCGCDGSSGPPGEPCGQDAVLLGTIDLAVTKTPTGEVVAADDGWAINERRRPFVLHTRMLQEWLLGRLAFDQGPAPQGPPGPRPQDDPGPRPGPRGGRGATAQAAVSAGPPGAGPAAAGRFRQVEGTSYETEWAVHAMTARPIFEIAAGLFFVAFDGYDRERRYVIHGTATVDWPADPKKAAPGHTFDLVAPGDELDKQLRALAEKLSAADQITLDRGFVVRILGTDGKTVPSGFVVEVSDVSEVSQP